MQFPPALILVFTLCGVLQASTDRLIRSVDLPLIIEGRTMGSMKLQAGEEVMVVSISGTHAIIKRGVATYTIDSSSLQSSPPSYSKIELDPQASIAKALEKPPFQLPVYKAPSRDTFDSRALNPTPDYWASQVAGTALRKISEEGYTSRSEKIEKTLENLASMQVRDPQSKDYGNFHFYWYQNYVGDWNALPFVTDGLSTLKLLYPDRLSPKAAATLDEILKYAIEAFNRNGPTGIEGAVDYTNIYLISTANILILGQAMKSPELISKGTRMLDKWIESTRKKGITEYSCPGYWGLDIGALARIANLSDDPVIRNKAKGALVFFWENIAANWFEADKRLSGSHGRDYDYLIGNAFGELKAFGWVPEEGKKSKDIPSVGDVRLWSPPTEIHDWATNAIPRFVSERFGTNDIDWASHYVGHHVSIGVSGTGRGFEDKVFVVNIAGPAVSKTVNVSFVSDGRSDPYGHKKLMMGKSGHMKAHHLDPIFRAVQCDQDVLFMSSYPGLTRSKDDTNNTCLHSHLIVPEEAVVWSVDKPLDQKLPSQPIPGNICFLRLGDVAVGIKFLLATDSSGKAVTAELVNDGHEFNAKRLSVTHSTVPIGNGRGTVAIAVRAAEGLDEGGFTLFRKKFTEVKNIATVVDNSVRLKTDGLRNPLVLEVDLTTGKVLRREGGDPSIGTAPLVINGKKIDLMTP